MSRQTEKYELKVVQTSDGLNTWEFVDSKLVDRIKEEEQRAAFFVEEMYGVTPASLAGKGLRLFPGVLRLSIKNGANKDEHIEDFLLAWKGIGHHDEIVALRQGHEITTDNRISITSDGMATNFGSDRNIRLLIHFDDAGFAADLQLDLNQTNERRENDKPIFTYSESCSDHVSYGDNGQLGVRLLGESLTENVRTTFNEAAMVAMDALSSSTAYEAMPLAA